MSQSHRLNSELEYLLYSETMYFDWLKLIMWLVKPNNSTLFESRVITPLWHLFIRLVPGVDKQHLSIVES